jgi:DNA-binding protein HU-beta
MTKDEVIREAAKKIGAKQTDVEQSYEAIIATLKEAFAKGEGHLIPNFINFRVENRAEYTGRNPKSGEPLLIPAKKILKAVASDSLLDAMNVVTAPPTVTEAPKAVAKGKPTAVAAE